MRYFDHDTNASDDDAVMALRLEHGGAAVDCYWALLEKMYRDERPLSIFGTDWETNTETKSVSHRLCLGSDELKKYIGTMLEVGLLEGTPEKLYSKRAVENIKTYQQRAETARQNGKKGGRKPTRKPSRNRVGSDVATNEETKTLARKEKKSIGFDKQNQYQYAADGAGALDAPPTAIQCPTCDAPMERTNLRKAGTDRHIWRCPLCHEEVSE